MFEHSKRVVAWWQGSTDGWADLNYFCSSKFNASSTVELHANPATVFECTCLHQRLLSSSTPAVVFSSARKANSRSSNSTTNNVGSNAWPDIDERRDSQDAAGGPEENNQAKEKPSFCEPSVFDAYHPVSAMDRMLVVNVDEQRFGYLCNGSRRVIRE